MNDDRSPMTHVSARMEPAVIARLDALAEAITPMGNPPKRATAVRAALTAGLDALERTIEEMKAAETKRAT